MSPALPGRLGWKWRRLRAMEGAELAWRLRQAMRAQGERLGIGLVGAVEPRGDCGAPWVSPLPKALDSRPYLQAADAILSGRFSIFALVDRPLGFPPTWNTDPKTGTAVPLGPGKTLDYRDAGQVGDIKYLWELNRHLELVTLAQAWHLSGDPRYSEGCRRMLESWFDACPYPRGPNWTSSLELGIRLVNWVVAWHLLGGESASVFQGEPGARFRRRWLQSVRQHCHFVAGWPSLHSSANNHLLGEYMGLFVAALTWPLWPESGVWLESARDGFAREVLLQNAADGVNREQAIWYQHEVLDMMLLCGLFGRANGHDFPAEFWRRLAAMIDFVAALMDRSGHVPAIGDADDAVMVRWHGSQARNPYRSLIGTGAILFGRGDWAATAGSVDDKTRWLLGDDVAFPQVNDEDAHLRRHAFREGGYYLLGGRYGQPDELQVVMDCGPLGYSSIAAHGHADALALLLSAGGQPILVDPGTYAYHADDRWRAYFRSTHAHNTVSVDELDQSESGGNFMWLRKAHARCLAADLTGEAQVFEGEHDGYSRLSDPVIHRRRVEVALASNTLKVTDDLECRGAHVAEVCWHFDDRVEVSLESGDVVARASGTTLRLAMPAGVGEVRLMRGETDPAVGWISSAYDCKRPTTTAIWKVAFTGSTRFETQMRLSFVATR